MPTASRFQAYLAYVEETTAGETPSSPTMKKLRTPDVLQLQKNKELLESEETYAHRQPVNTRHGFKSPAGSVPIELSYGAFDDMLEALLGGEWSDEAAGSENTLKVGNNIKTFSIERGFPDISQYEVFRGMIPNSLSLDITPNGIVTGNFDFIGMNFDDLGGTSLGSPDDVATNPPFDGLGSASLKEAGSSIAIVTSLSFQITNNRAVGRLVGSEGGDVPNNGMFELTGNLTARFQDETLLAKFENGTSSSLQVVLNDEGGSEYLQFDFHDILYNGGTREDNENNLDVNLPFIARYDSTETTAATITRSNA